MNSHQQKRNVALHNHLPEKPFATVVEERYFLSSSVLSSSDFSNMSLNFSPPFRLENFSDCSPYNRENRISFSVLENVKSFRCHICLDTNPGREIVDEIIGTLPKFIFFEDVMSVPNSMKGILYVWIMLGVLKGLYPL